jgi:protein gp37
MSGKVQRGRGKAWTDHEIGALLLDHAMMERTTVTKRKRVEGSTLAPGRRWRPARVFLGSMTDMFHETLDFQALASVWRWMARHCQDEPGPIWQIVTKRPERAVALLPMLQQHTSDACGGALPVIHLMTTVGVHSSLPRLDALLACHGIPGVEVLGVSAEPLLEAVDFRPWLATGRIAWVILGGESGPRARPCHVDWIRDVVVACQEHGVRCWVKQVGARPVVDDGPLPGITDPSGSNLAEWPADLRVQEWPSA